MNKAISKQKLTFILAGYRDVLRISLFADYEQIFNEGLQPQDKLNIISFACKVALGSDPNVTADALEKTYQSKHISELKRGFVNKLNLIKHSYFLPRNSLLDLYFKVILPSATYALPIWGCWTNKNEFNSLESIHCRAARVIYNLPRDMPSEDVRITANWDSLFDTYKVKIATTPKGQRSLTPSETWTLVKSHRKWAVPKLTGISPCIDHIHIFYCTYSTFYWLHSGLIILIIYFY